MLLPVYNGAEYLVAAMESILSQSYRNFEVIIIDDGSSDDSADIIRKFQDPRIRAYRQDNQGLAATLNRSVNLAKGEYLARQDQDDLSLPTRFEKQVEFLEAHKDYGMVGTWAEIWVGNAKSERIHRHPAENLHLQFDLLFDNPFVHSSVMVRKSVLDRVGLYSTDRTRQPPEDYELWSRVARQFNVANIPEVLLIYREVLGSMSRAGASPFLDRVINISIENLLWATSMQSQNSHVTDLAALNHAAYHRVSHEPRLDKLSRVVLDAAVKLSDLCNAPRNALEERARARVDNIRIHYSRCMSRISPRNTWGDLIRAVKRATIG